MNNLWMYIGGAAALVWGGMTFFGKSVVKIMVESTTEKYFVLIDGKWEPTTSEAVAFNARKRNDKIDMALVFYGKEAEAADVKRFTEVLSLALEKQGIDVDVKAVAYTALDSAARVVIDTCHKEYWEDEDYAKQTTDEEEDKWMAEQDELMKNQ